MTEAEWLTATDPRPMFQWLRDRTPPPTDRKWRLVLAGCARQAWDRIPPGPQREAVEAAEQYADGDATEDEMKRCHMEYYTLDDARRSRGKAGLQIDCLCSSTV